MFGKKKEPEVKKEKKKEELTTLYQTDTPFQRVYNMMKYAGFVNPINRNGSVDAMATILEDYMRMDGVIIQEPLQKEIKPDE